MPLKFEQKQTLVSEVNTLAKGSVSLVVLQCQGLTVPQITHFRDDARKAGLTVRVVPNTLARRAFEGTQFACLQANNLLIGPNLLVFSSEELGAGARVVRGFMKDHEAMKVMHLVLMDKLLSSDALDKVAKLPSREEALSSLMAVMKAPLTKFVGLCNELNAKFVRVVAAVAEKRRKK